MRRLFLSSMMVGATFVSSKNHFKVEAHGSLAIIGPSGILITTSGLSNGPAQAARSVLASSLQTETTTVNARTRGAQI